MEFENSFTVPAPRGETWSFLNDVPRVIPCMPGAELVDSLGEDSWKARMAVKIGPMALKFDTEVTRRERDDAAHRVVLVAKAREVRGRGMADATVTSSLSDGAEGTQVLVATDLSLRGPVAQHGGHLVADIASQMTQQFAECLTRELSRPPTSEPAGEGAAAAGRPGAGAPPSAAPVAPPPAEPVKGLRLLLRALWRSLGRPFRRRR